MNKYTWVQKHSRLDNPYWIEEIGLAVEQQLLDVVFYIYPTVKEAESGEGSVWGGTGFYVSVPSAEHEHVIYCYAVTNAHIIEGLRAQNCQSVLRFNTKDGKLDTVEVPLENWRLHPKGDDVAVCPLGLSSQWKIKTVPSKKWLLTEQDVERHLITLGDDTVTLGRYSKHSGIKQNLVTARFGHISMLPREPVVQDDRGGFPQDSFLVETYSVAGYSGSPVFMQLDPDDRGAPEPIKERKGWLLGIDWGHFDFTGEIKTDTVTGRLKAPSGMMCVVPAWKLQELLDVQELEDMRKNNDKKLSERIKKSGVSLDSNLSRGEFEGVLKKVSKKIDPTDRDQRKPKK